MPVSKMTALLRAHAISTGTLADAERVLTAARMPASAAFALLQRAAAAGELTVQPDGTFTLTAALPAAAPQGAPAMSADEGAQPPTGQRSDTTDSSNSSVNSGIADNSAPAKTGGGPDATGPSDVAGVRIIAFDVEAALRARVEDGGALTRRIWQLGAVKFGSDPAWTAAGGRNFNA